MAQPTFDSPAWYRALTLTERLALLRGAASAADSAGAGAPFDAELAERRLQHWRGQPSLAREEVFAQRLAADGLTEAEFRQLLGEPVEVVRDRAVAAGGGRPRWLDEVEAALREMPAAD